MGTSISLTSSDGFQLSGYRAEPEGPARGGVVVVQEIFGVNDHIRSVADRYAAAGYLAIAPAIFDRERPGIELGYTPEDIEVGRGIASGSLDFQNVLADVAAAGAVAREAGKRVRRRTGHDAADSPLTFGSSGWPNDCWKAFGIPQAACAS